jgi:hypothetical protein
MHLNRDTAIMRELTELTAAELDIVSGGAAAAAAVGDFVAGAGAADFVLAGGALIVSNVFGDFAGAFDNVNDVAIAHGSSI